MYLENLGPSSNRVERERDVVFEISSSLIEFLLYFDTLDGR